MTQRPLSKRPVYEERPEWKSFRAVFTSNHTTMTGQVVGIRGSVSNTYRPTFSRDPLAIRTLDGIKFAWLDDLVNVVDFARFIAASLNASLSVELSTPSVAPDLSATPTPVVTELPAETQGQGDSKTPS